MHQVFRWLRKQREVVLWNSKSQINLSAVEGAKPQTSLTRARNVQCSGFRTSIYYFPFPTFFNVLWHSLPLFLVLCSRLQCFFTLFHSTIISLHLETGSFPTQHTHTHHAIVFFHICRPPPAPHVSASLFLLPTLGGDLVLGRWFLELSEQMGAVSQKVVTQRGQTLHHILDDRQKAIAVNLNGEVAVYVVKRSESRLCCDLNAHVAPLCSCFIPGAQELLWFTGYGGGFDCVQVISDAGHGCQSGRVSFPKNQDLNKNISLSVIGIRTMLKQHLDLICWSSLKGKHVHTNKL